jgi:hypothetical protein
VDIAVKFVLIEVVMRQSAMSNSTLPIEQLLTQPLVLLSMPSRSIESTFPTDRLKTSADSNRRVHPSLSSLDQPYTMISVEVIRSTNKEE